MITRLVVLQLGIGTALLVALVLLGLTVVGLRDSSRELVAIDRLMRTANRVQAVAVDSQAAIRGYLLTGDARFLDPVEDARLELAIAARQLRRAAEAPVVADALAEDIADRAMAFRRDFTMSRDDALKLDRDATVAAVARGEGRRRVAELRQRIAQLRSAMDAVRAQSSRAEERRSAWALRGAVIVAFLTAAAALTQFIYLRRSVVEPIDGIEEAATRIGGGDLGARVPVRRHDEIGALAVAFNRMAQALQENDREIASQYSRLANQHEALGRQAEALAAQSAELEGSKRELRASNAELLQRTQELERSTDQLRRLGDRTALIAAALHALAGVQSVRARAERLLDVLVDRTGAERGWVYVVGHDDTLNPELASAQGPGIAGLPDSLAQMGGPAAEAHSARRTVLVPCVGAEGGRQTCELHLPLVARGAAIGVVSVVRPTDRPFDDDEIELLEQVSLQAALAVDNAVQQERARWHADVARSVLDASQDAIALLTLDGESLLTNPAMERFAVDVLGTRGVDDKRDPSEIVREIAVRTADPETYIESYRTMMADPDHEGELEYQFVDSGRWVYRYTAPVRAGDGSLIGRIVVMRETTEQRELDRVKDELMATVSHELRTPLSAVLGFTELLKARDYPREEREEYIATVHEQAMRLSEMIDDFLDLQRLEHTAGRLDHHPVDVGRIVQDEAAVFDAHSERHEVVARVGDDLVVDVDAARVRRAVGNLISNAVKYSPDGGRVTVDVLSDADHVTIAVSDRGIGVPADAQPQIFDRFFRVDSSTTARIGGTGLGLSLVREIAEAHGGDVGLESEEGKGSRFWIRLPRTP